MGCEHAEDSVWRGFTQAIEWTIIVLAAAALAVAVLIPKAAGATPYTVLTGSMRPTMPPGTLVVVHRVNPAQVGVGDVVTYEPTPGDPGDVITHRVVATGFDANGHRTFQTQGDANPAPDPAMVHDYQVVGKRWYFVPYLGYLTRVLTGQQRHVGVDGAASALAVYAAAMFVGEWRERRRRRVSLDGPGARA